MINRIHRFHGHNSLRYVYQNGQTVRSSQMALKYVLNTRRTQYRLAIVISKKVTKSAVKRNKLRRRIYEQVRLREAEIKKPYDLVITVFHDQLLEIKSTELQRLIDSQLRQAGIIGSTTAQSDPPRGKI